MNREMTVSIMWRTLKHSLLIILAVTLVAMLAAGAFTKYVLKEKYSSSITFYVVNTSVDTEYTTTSLLAATESLASTYIEIILGDTAMDAAVEYLKNEYELEYTANQIRSMITTSIDGDSSTFSVKVTNTNNEVAFIVARYISQNAPAIIKQVVIPSVISPDDPKMNVERVKVLRVPTLDAAPDSPNMVMNVVIAASVAFIATYIVCLVLALSNSTIKTEDDLKAVIASKYHVIGLIPTWYKK